METLLLNERVDRQISDMENLFILAILEKNSSNGETKIFTLGGKLLFAFSILTLADEFFTTRWTYSRDLKHRLERLLLHCYDKYLSEAFRLRPNNSLSQL